MFCVDGRHSLTCSLGLMSIQFFQDFLKGLVQFVFIDGFQNIVINRIFQGVVGVFKLFIAAYDDETAGNI